MRRFICAAFLVACGACSGDQGNTDGKCYPPDTAGKYRCRANSVQICTAADHPGNELPYWFVVKDCSIPSAPGVYGACVVNGTGTEAHCQYVQ